jgi:hypothetical protein
MGQNTFHTVSFALKGTDTARQASATKDREGIGRRGSLVKSGEITQVMHIWRLTITMAPHNPLFYCVDFYQRGMLLF